MAVPLLAKLSGQASLSKTVDAQTGLTEHSGVTQPGFKPWLCNLRAVAPSLLAFIAVGMIVVSPLMTLRSA